MGGGVSRCDPIPGPGVGDFQSPASHSPINDRGFFLTPAALGAITNLIPDVLPFFAPLKRPATDWTGFRGPIARANPRDNTGSLCPLSTHQRQRARTDPESSQKFRATAQLSEYPIQPDQIKCCDADRIDANTITQHWPDPNQSKVNSLAKINTYLRFKKLLNWLQAMVIV